MRWHFDEPAYVSCREEEPQGMLPWKFAPDGIASEGANYLFWLESLKLSFVWRLQAQIGKLQ